jgi:DNA-binding CsgD family transcriptional regulator
MVDGFVGRRSELAFLADRLAEVRTGRLCAVVVEGEPGVGKSMLVRRFIAGLADARVLVASADDAESSITYGAVAQLVDDVDGPLPDPLGALSAAEGPDAVPARVGAAVVALAGQLLTARPTLVVVVDNVQWADAASQQALAFALRRLRTDPVLFLFVLPSASSVRLSDGLQRVITEIAVRLRVVGLDTQELRELAVAVAARPISARAAARVHEVTGGNALYARALLEELPQQVLDGGGDPLPAPRTFGLVVLSRLAGCAEDVRRLVVAAAVLGLSCRLADAARLAEVTDPLAALEGAVSAALLAEAATTVEHRVTFPHPLVRAAIYHDLGPARRSALHTRAARVVDDPDDQLRHRVAAAVVPDEPLAAAVAAAAGRLAGQGRWVAAANHLLAAAKLSPVRSTRERRFVDALNHLLYGGEATRAAAHLAEVPDIADAPRRDYIRGRLALLGGAPAEAAALLEAAWQAIDKAAEPQLARAVAEQLVSCHAAVADLNVAAEWGFRAMALGPPPAGMPSTITDGLIIALTDLGRLDEARRLAADVPVPVYPRLVDARLVDARLGDAHLVPARLVGVPPRSGLEPDRQAWPDGLVGRGVVRLAADELEAARDALTVAVEAHRRRGPASPYGLLALMYLADVKYRLGAWDEATVHAELAASIAVDADQDYLVPLCHAVAVYPLAGQGLPAAADHLRAAASHPVARSPHAGTTVMLARARLAHAHSDDAQVAAALAGFIELAELAREDIPEPSWLPWRALYAEALAHLGRPEDADAVLVVLEEGAAARGHRSALLMASRVRGAIEVARGRTAGGEAAYQRGLELAADLPVPFERGLLELDYGSFLRRGGQRGAAVDLLERARERFASLGAEPYLVRCERELAGCGRTLSRRSQGAAEALTPQELTVARLAAGGLSNREVAGELVLSVKTIEYHLGNVYAKLGLRSRGQLAGALRAGR